MGAVSDNRWAKFKELCEMKSHEAGIADVNALVTELMEVVEDHLTKRDDELYKEIKGISERINQAKEEISKPVSADIVTDAKQELNAVVKSTEEATNMILDLAEHIQSCLAEIPDKAVAEKIQQDISKIFEACNFQDLTGQRIAKVTNTLQFVDVAVGNLLKTLARSLKEDQQGSQTEYDRLKNGPQLQKFAPSQDDIDKLFEQA